MKIPPVHIDGVAHGLEGIERNTHGQDQPQLRDLVGKPRGSANGVDGACKKVKVFEGEQQSQIAENADQKQQLHQGAIAAVRFHAQAAAIIQHRGNQQQHDQRGIGVHVEEIGGRQKPVFPVFVGQQPVDGHHNGKEDQKNTGIKIHSSTPMFSSKNTNSTVAHSHREAPLIRL